MAKFKVKYTMVVEQIIDWPDDELEDINSDTVLANCDISDAYDYSYEDIIEIEKDGEKFDF